MNDIAICDICGLPFNSGGFTRRFIDGAGYHHQCGYDLKYKFSLLQKLRFYIQMFIRTGKIWKAY